MKSLRFIWVGMILLFLTACGGGGGGGSNLGNNESPDGLWSGSFRSAGVDYDLSAFVHDNYLFAISIDADTLYEGTVSVNGSTLSGTVAVYESGGFTVMATLSGTVNENQTITGQDEDGNTFTLAFDDIYNRSASFTKLEGIWSYSDVGGYTSTITIDPDGSFNGSDTDGCSFAGNFAVPEPDHNIYEISLNVDNCGPYDGDYEGLGALDDLNTTEDLLGVVATSPEWLSFSLWERMP